MNKLEMMGFGKISKDINHSAYDYNLYMNILADKYVARSEGLLGTAIKTPFKAVGMGIRGSRNAYTVTKKLLINLFRIIKNILVGFIKMIKQMWLDVNKNTTRMKGLVGKINELASKINSVQDNQAPGTDASFDSVTTRTLNGAGWNLKLPENEDKNLNTVVGRFMERISRNKDGASPEDVFMSVNNMNTLYQSLERMFVAAKQRIESDKNFQQFATWDKNIAQSGIKNAINKGVNAITSNYSYRALNEVNYGKFVAQAFSPAGAYVSTNNKELWQSKMDRVQNYEGLMTPIKEKGIPGDKIKEELISVCRYMAILFDYILKAGIPQYLKARSDKINRLIKSVDNLAKLTIKDIDSKINQKNDGKAYDNMNKGKDANYGELDENGNAKTGSAASFKLFGLEDMMDELKSFNENEHEGNFNATGNAMNDSRYNNNPFSTNTVNNPKEHSINKDTLNITETDVTKEGITYGLNYFRSYLNEAGNLLFQEGRFFNSMTKVMCNTAEEFVSYTESAYLEYQNNNVANQNNDAHNQNTNNTNNKDINENYERNKEDVIKNQNETGRDQQGG